MEDEHLLDCHRPRIPDRVVFDKLIQVLVLGAAHEKMPDSACLATAVRRRQDAWIDAGIFAQLEQVGLEVHEPIVGV